MVGNHEIIFDLLPQKARALIPGNVVLLENSGITYKCINFYSVAARSCMHQEVKIPANTDFLITHGPPVEILDDDRGCRLLRKAVFESKPKFHLFGHIHHLGYQRKTINNIHFCNVSVWDKLKSSK